MLSLFGKRGSWLGRAALLALAVTVFLAGFFYGNYGRAATIAPGSDADPLVSLSYVEHQVKLNVIELAPGQRLEAEGGTQIILRSGRATAVASPQGGVSDLTAGRDLGQGQRVSLNHLLLVPRTDGRGIVAETGVFVMVRGPYTIK